MSVLKVDDLIYYAGHNISNAGDRLANARFANWDGARLINSVRNAEHDLLQALSRLREALDLLEE